MTRRIMTLGDIVPDWVWDTAYRDTQPMWPFAQAWDETPRKPIGWFDAGYLNNGHCSFMRVRDGASCCGSHGHNGEHHYP